MLIRLQAFIGQKPHCLFYSAVLCVPSDTVGDLHHKPHDVRGGGSFCTLVTGTERRLKRSETLGLRLRCFWTRSDLFGCPRPSPKAVSSWETNSSTLEDSGNETTLSMCHPELTLFHFLPCVSHSCWCVCSCSGTPASLHKAVFQCRGSNYVSDGTQIEVSDQICTLLTPLGPR